MSATSTSPIESPDLIHDPAYTPAFNEISAYINPPVRMLWQELNAFVQETFRAAPKIFYSVCAGKPGWNVKYQKSGKSLCTLYPERDCFIALVVIKEEMAPQVLNAQPAPPAIVRSMITDHPPFNHTHWLMIPITEVAMLEWVKDLLVQKRNFVP